MILKKKQWDGVSIDETNKLHYSYNSPQIDIKSLDDLKTQLSDQTKLKDALKEAGATVDETATYTIKNQPGLTDDDLIHVNVESSKASATATNYDLQIPASDINLVISDLNVKVSGADVTEVNEKVNLNYNIAIKDETSYTGPADIKKMNATPTEDSVMQELGFKATTRTKRSTDATPAATVALNSEKIGETLGVFNTEFSNPVLELDSTNNPSSTNNFFTYKITVTGTPKEGYHFEGGETSKQFSFLVKITEVTASYSTTNIGEYNKLSFAWTNSGVNNPTTSNKNTLNTKLQNHANGTATDANIQKMLDEMTSKAKEQKILENADFYLSDDDKTNGYIKFESNKWQVRVIAKVKAGYEAKTGIDFTKMKLWITITFAQAS
ncbi:P35 lipoprotein homolog fragment [Malacoplasma penetrans HF-2]|uniref:P35 lipoprotein homolog n=1 Tax=Malacoplasma penetrans (strain HF-2) TaxID=272633 RepID=Q8EV29_MALP2|nr:P35 family lipoprotein [Malacoplasma penetrans]BAC44532.1 P35 lipoprotein homolog fragment [Malacoplasma penetrans HF-2]